MYIVNEYSRKYRLASLFILVRKIKNVFYVSFDFECTYMIAKWGNHCFTMLVPLHQEVKATSTPLFYNIIRQLCKHKSL